MKILLVAGLLVCMCCVDLSAQKAKTEKTYTCGFYAKDFASLKETYEILRLFDVKKGENVASVGAANGSVEVNIAVFVDSVDWTLQDIDTFCLNKTELQKVVSYDEMLKGKTITGTFALVQGEETTTNLPRYKFDRVLLSNVYHELTDRKSIMIDIHESLTQDDVVVIKERRGTKRGQKHADCGYPKIYEPDFINEMKSFGYTLIDKKNADKFDVLVFYTFKKIPS